MPATGGFSPSPERFGGGELNSRDPLLKRVFESLAAGRGSAYDQTVSSTVGVENMAYARALTFDGYGGNQRLVNNFFPNYMTAAGLLPRWEKIFGKPMNFGDTEPTRRARIAAAWNAFVVGNTIQPVTDMLNTTLGTLLVSVTLLNPNSSNLLVWWPGNPNVNPGMVPWYSNISKLYIKLTIPAGYGSADNPNAKWNAAVAQAGQGLDQMLPAWVAYEFYIANSVGSFSFRLDDAHNLDLEVFGT